MKMKKLFLFMTFTSLIIFSIINGCSKDDKVIEQPEGKSYKASFSNNSYGCATIKLKDSTEELFSETTEHNHTDTGTFTTLDSTITVTVNSSSHFSGIMFSIYDGSNNRLGSVNKSGTSASTVIKSPADGIIKISLFFYNPCPIPDEPGCPVPPDKPYSCL